MTDPHLFAKLERRVEYDTNGGCWLWAGTLFESGYGSVSISSRPTRAHRAMWTAVHSHPAEQLVLHHCDTPACINPDHLRLGSAQDNADDRAKRGRGRTTVLHGSKNGRAKLDEAKVALIHLRLNAGEREADLAREFRVAPCTINNIRHGRKWRAVDTRARND